MNHPKIKPNKTISGSFILAAAILLVIATTGCYYDKEELLYPGSVIPVNCSTTSAKFGADVQPIISGRCATSGCHDVTASGGVILQTYTQISGKKDRINARAVVEKSMPTTGPLRRPRSASPAGRGDGQPTVGSTPQSRPRTRPKG